jgi:hypothetical protein
MFTFLTLLFGRERVSFLLGRVYMSFSNPLLFGREGVPSLSRRLHMSFSNPLLFQRREKLLSFRIAGAIDG